MTDGERDDGGPLPVDELFSVLGNETRMEILEVLWEDFSFDKYVVREQVSVPFSELGERIGVRDSGNFNYHLGRLTGTLLEGREDGYVLTPLGYNLMRSITTYASYDYRTVEETALDQSCPFCGGVLTAAYERELLNVSCRDCGGLGSGNVNVVHSPATNGQGLDLDGMLDATTLQLMDRVLSSSHGLCGSCRGRVDRSVAVCEDHRPGADGTCETCLSRFAASLEVDCPHCGSGGVGPLVEYAIVSTPVRAFFERRDLGPHDVGPWRYRLACFKAVGEAVEGTTPTRVRYEFSVDDDVARIRLTERDDRVNVRRASADRTAD